MRHKVYGKKLGRTKNERTALFKSLVQALVLQGSIVTSEAKAKAIRGMVDKIITQAKNKDTRRLLQSFLISKPTQEKLLNEIIPNLGNRNSGYTSLVRMGSRVGDGAFMVKMSFMQEESTVTRQPSETKNKKTKDVILGSEVTPESSKKDAGQASMTKKTSAKAPRKAVKK